LISHIYSIAEFVKKTGAVSVCLIYDATDLKQSVVMENGAGYVCPDPNHPFEQPVGLKSWPAVFHWPESKIPIEHWPNLVSIIMDRLEFLQQQRGIYHYSEVPDKKDKGPCCTYYVCCIEPRMYLAAIYDKIKKKTDDTITTFVQSLTHGLRLNYKLRRLIPTKR
jgi:KICSTOR complex C12orf66 like